MAAAADVLGTLHHKAVSPIIHHDDAIIAMTVFATVINVANAEKKNTNPMTPILSGFVVSFFLIALAYWSNVVARSLAAAFLITSAVTNGSAILDAIGDYTGQVGGASGRGTNGQSVVAGNSAVTNAATAASLGNTSTMGSEK